MSRWTGPARSGSRSFEPSQRAAILTYLRQHVGATNWTTNEQIAAHTGIEGRTLREILSQIDGVDVVIGYDQGDHLFVCQTPSEAESFNRRLEAQIHTTQERLDRRRRLLPHEDDQTPLFTLQGVGS